jgi:hypothetical protein
VRRPPATSFVVVAEGLVHLPTRVAVAVAQLAEHLAGNWDGARSNRVGHPPACCCKCRTT